MSNEMCGNGTVDRAAGESCDAGDELPTYSCTVDCRSLSGQIAWLSNFLIGSKDQDHLFNHYGRATGIGEGGSLIYAMQTENRLSGLRNPVLYKFKPEGEVGWGRNVFVSRDGNGRDDVTDLAVSPSGVPVVTGYFESNELAFKEDQNALETNSGADEYIDYRDIFFAAYDKSSSFQAAASFGHADEDETAHAIALDSTGATYLAGAHEGSLAFGRESFSTGSGFIVKIGSDGRLAWKESFEGAEITGMAMGPDDKPVVIGRATGGSVRFDAGTLEAEDDSEDVFVAKFGGSGAHEWSYVLDGPGRDRALTVDVGKDGAVYAGGDHRQTTNVLGTTITQQSGSRSDAWLAKWSGEGELQWAKSFGADGEDAINRLAAPGTGEVFVAGEFSAPEVSLGAGSVSGTSSTDNMDAFAARFGADGTHDWSVAMTGPEFDRAVTLTTDGERYLYVTLNSKSPTLSTPAGDVSKGYEDPVTATFIGRLVP
jgi:hypothetical protein